TVAPKAATVRASSFNRIESTSLTLGSSRAAQGLPASKHRGGRVTRGSPTSSTDHRVPKHDVVLADRAFSVGDPHPQPDEGVPAAGRLRERWKLRQGPVTVAVRCDGVQGAT